MTTNGATPILEARGLVKRYGHVTALAGSDFDLRPGEILAVIGDNGAGKSSLIKCLSGAVLPDEGEILLDGKPIQMRTPIDARAYGIETVYQTLAVSPSLDIADNLFLGREPRAPGVLGKVFRKLDRGKMRAEAKQQMTELGIMTIQDITQQVESLSGGQRQGVGRQGGGVRQQGDHPRRADGGARREGVRTRARADPQGPRQRNPRDPDQP